MAKKKLQRFAELATFPNVFQGWYLNDTWYQDFFKNDKRVTLELACGKGEYTLALAQKYPGRNFIGIDVKGARLWCGARTALDLNLPNVAFLRMPIGKMHQVFGEKTVNEIWIPFPDPFPKRRKENCRLTSPGFLTIYKKLLCKGAKIHLKTDDKDFYEYTLRVLDHEQWKIHRVIDDLYFYELNDEFLAVQTTYELKHLAAGRTIKYICFSFEASTRSRKF